jgi:hypothetical protein
MKGTSCTVIVLLISLFGPVGSPAQVLPPVVRDSSLRVFLPRFEEGTSRFINGDPALWKQTASQQGDVTIMGAWGGYERGWQRVGARYDGVAARLQPTGTQVGVEYLSSGVDGDLA